MCSVVHLGTLLANTYSSNEVTCNKMLWLLRAFCLDCKTETFMVIMAKPVITNTFSTKTAKCPYLSEVFLYILMEKKLFWAVMRVHCTGNRPKLSTDTLEDSQRSWRSLWFVVGKLGAFAKKGPALHTGFDAHRLLKMRIRKTCNFFSVVKKRHAFQG